MHTDIHFERQTNFIGRNGMFKQGGVALTETQERTVMVEPITSKRIIGRALLEIPISSLPAVTEFLNQVWRKHNNAR